MAEIPISIDDREDKSNSTPLPWTPISEWPVILTGFRKFAFLERE